MFAIISVGQPITFIAIIIAVVYFVETLRVRFRPGLCQLPGPPLAAYSRLWNVFNAAGGKSHKSFQELHQKYGSVVRVGPNHVAIAEPAMLPIIYGTNNKFLKSGFYDAFGTPYEGKPMHSMFSTRDTAQHKSLKQAVANKFSLSALRDFEAQIDSCSDMFISVMHEFAATNKVVDLGAWLQWYAFDVIGAITFSRTFGFMDERKDIQDIIAGIESGLWFNSIVGQIPELHTWLHRLINLLSVVKAVDNANPVPKIIKMVEDAICDYDQDPARNETRSNFLALFRKEHEKSPERMPHRDLMNHLMNNLLAGSDTTAISLRAIFYYLIKNPLCCATLLEEIDSAEQEGRISPNTTLTESSQMPYLQACMKEAVRLHPGVGFPLERIVPDNGLDIGHVHLPKGTIVGMNAWVLHQDKKVYGEDADKFRPERWLTKDIEQLRLMERSFLSFGAGTRTCIGKNISIMEMGKIVPQILRHFDISWAAPEKEWKVKTFWFAKQSGLHVQFRPRKKVLQVR